MNLLFGFFTAAKIYSNRDALSVQKENVSSPLLYYRLHFTFFYLALEFFSYNINRKKEKIHTRELQVTVVSSLCTETKGNREFIELASISFERKYRET